MSTTIQNNLNNSLYQIFRNSSKQKIFLKNEILLLFIKAYSDYDYMTLSRIGVPKSFIISFWHELINIYQFNLRSKIKNFKFDFSINNDLENEWQLSERLIDLDVHRTFNSQENKLINEKRLKNLLSTVVRNNLDIGYCQGMNFVGGLLICLSETDDKITSIFEEIIIRRKPYYMDKMYALKRDLYVLKRLIISRFKNLKDINFFLQILATQWILCLFTKKFRPSLAGKVLNAWLIEGDCLIFKFILGTLDYAMKSENYNQNDDIIQVVHDLYNLIDESVYFNHCYKYPLKKKTIIKYRKKYDKKNWNEPHLNEINQILSLTLDFC